jgi:regulator of cell morphogenesis and NO signaling
LAEVIPFSTRVLKKKEVNACCRPKKRGGVPGDPRETGGSLPVELARISPVGERAIGDWIDRPLRDLVLYIVESFHRPLGVKLLNLETLVGMVTESHSEENRGASRRLYTAFAKLRDEVLDHLFKEEDIIFPWIASGNGRSAADLVDDLGTQHKVIAVQLKTVITLAEEFARDDHRMCDGIAALCATLGEVETVLSDHIHMETNLLYPRALRE